MISSLYNRFSRWAEQQPQKKLEKLYGEIARDQGYFSYIREQDAFAWRVKSIAKDGAQFTARELLAAIKQESRALSMFSRDEPKVVQAMLAAGAVPDDACYEAAQKGELACFAAFLRDGQSISTAQAKYALACHGDDVDLIKSMFARKPPLTPDVLSAAVGSYTLVGDARIEAVKVITAAGVVPKARSLEYAIAKFSADTIALHLLDAGAPATVEAMIEAINEGKKSIVQKLFDKGASFDETLAKCPRELQVRVKAYRKLIAGVSESEELIVELQAQIKDLTARLEKVEGGAADKKAKPAVAKAATP